MRCLSDAALERLVADLATAEERAHLAGCLTCTGRHRRIVDDLGAVARVLMTERPAPRARAATRRRWAVAALVTAAAAVLWTGAGQWWPGRALRATPPQQVAVALADISSVLFSVDGEPDRVRSESPISSLLTDDDRGGSCDELWGRPDADCPGVWSAVTGAIDGADIGALDGDGRESGEGS